jgi:NAD(P)-dependent dehydrogenase (short-subunit alcohol dehydrogenase family)
MNRIALVTGGGRGIGRAIAEKFASRKIKIAICSRNLAELKETAAFLSKNYQADALPLVCDVTDELQVEETIKKIITRWGRLDVLVNNAGISKFGDWINTSTKDFDEVMKVNLYGTYYCSKVALALMIKQKFGRIINISSIKAFTPEDFFGSYAVSKMAIITLTKSMSLENTKYGITVNAICPGYVDSGHIDKKYYSKLIKEVPQRRMIMSEEIADLVSFLARKESKGITGQAIVIGAGMGDGLESPKDIVHYTEKEKRNRDL